jgi:hypothetical protein
MNPSTNTHPLVQLAMEAEDFNTFNSEINSTMKFIEENFDTIKSLPKQKNDNTAKTKGTKKRVLPKNDPNQSIKKPKNQTIYVQSDSDVEQVLFFSHCG